MASWPEGDELKQVVDVTSDDWNDTIDRLLASAIAKVKADVGLWVEDTDEPDDSLAAAALRMAELMAQKPEASTAVLGRDPAYLNHLYGHRRRFGVA